uniref:hypothetical protein n=1 Tax=Altererythrobacter segetis TaxID=1104773 RepID=UPI00140B8477|nr:hypothetical protein [Altererythrobacter segetis]
MTTYRKNFVGFTLVSIIVVVCFELCLALGADARAAIILAATLCGLAVLIEHIRGSSLFRKMGLPALVFYSGLALAAATDFIGGPLGSLGLILSASVMLVGVFFVIARLSRPPVDRS